MTDIDERIARMEMAKGNVSPGKYHLVAVGCIKAIQICGVDPDDSEKVIVKTIYGATKMVHKEARFE